VIQILFGIWLHLLKQSCREFHGEQFFFLLQPLKSFVKASKVLFKLFGEKKFKKKEKETGAAGPTRLPFGPASSAACFPLLSLSRARRPPRSTRRRPRGGRTPALDASQPTGLTWSERHPAPRRAILSPPRSPLLPPLTSATAVAVPPQRHHRKSPAAHRRSRQWPILGAKATTALAFTAVSFCARSTG